MPKNKDSTPRRKVTLPKGGMWLSEAPPEFQAKVAHLMNAAMSLPKKPNPPHYPSDMSPGTRISGGSDLDQE